MEFFLDTADIKEIEALLPTGMVDGITTNPTLIAKSGRKWQEVVKEMCAIVEGPISVEVASLDYETMIKEARTLSQINEKIAVKVPLTPAGLRVCKELSEDEIMVNVTLCFSPLQAILAAKAGATFVSPFVGRLDDIGHDGIALIKEISDVYKNSLDFSTNILGASIRHPMHVLQAAKAGADIVTIPPKILWQMYNHPLTESGIDAFVKDWAATGQTI